MKDGPDPGSDVSVRLTFSRPQRRATPQELKGKTGKWIDIGGLFHWAQGCPQSSYSGADSILEPATTPQGNGEPPFFFIDKAADQLANRGNTFSYTLNLTQCFAASGSFDPGAALGLSFVAALPTNPTINGTGGYLFRNQP